MILNTSSYFSLEDKGLAHLYYPDLHLMYIASYIKRHLTNIDFKVIDPNVRYTDTEEVQEIFSRLRIDNSINGIHNPLGITNKTWRKASNAIYFYVTSHRKEFLARLKDDIRRYNPKIIAIPFNYTSLYSQSVAMVKIARECAPGAKIIVGGAHATFDCENLMAQFPGIDILVLGEAELTVYKILKEFKEGNLEKTIQDIDGILYRDGSFVRKTGIPRPIENLDILPNPYLVSDEFGLEKKRKLSSLMQWDRIRAPNGQYFFPAEEDPATVFITSRGCPYDCSYCSNEAFTGRHVRFHSIDYVEDMVNYCCKRFHLKSAHFSDAMFTVNKKRTMELCDRIKPFNLKWQCQTRIDSLDEEVLCKLKDMGAYTIALGLETFNPEAFLDSGKRCNIKEISKKVQMIHGHGVEVIGTFIAGLPSEDQDSIFKNARLARQMKIDRILFFPLVAVIGSTIYSRLLREVPEHKRCSFGFGLEKKDLLYTARFSKPKLLYIAYRANSIATGKDITLPDIAILKYYLTYFMDIILPPFLVTKIRTIFRYLNII